MEHIAQEVNMYYVFGAEEYNWLLECDGVTKVTMIDSMTIVDFETKQDCIDAFDKLVNYEMNHYSMCETRLLLSPNT